MSRGLIGGMTAYEHQTFDDIIGDLTNEQNNLGTWIEELNEKIEISVSSNYWNTHVPAQFISIVIYALKVFNTAKTEIASILSDLSIEVKSHHIIRLSRIAHTAYKLNVDIGIVWHQQYDNKDFKSDDFKIIEAIYRETRGTAVDLLDIGNIAERLNDFEGYKSMIPKSNNPWISGSFYFVCFIVAITIVCVIIKLFNPVLLPIVIIAAIFIVLVVGILQLRNDDRITDSTFRALVKELLRRLPLLNKLLQD